MSDREGEIAPSTFMYVPPPPPPRSFSSVDPPEIDILEMTIPYNLILQEGPIFTSTTVPLTDLTLSTALDVLNTELEAVNIKWHPNLKEMIRKNTTSITGDYLNRTLAMLKVIEGMKTHIDSWISKKEYDDYGNVIKEEYDGYGNVIKEEYEDYGIIIVDLLNIKSEKTR